MSLANAFNHLAPEPPDYQARYQALYFEPIPQSGERFTIGIMAQDETGEARVIQTLADKTLRCLYGNQAEAIQNLVSLILDSARTHLGACPRIEPRMI